MSLLHFSRVLSGVEESLSLPIAPTLSAARLNDTTVRYSWTGGSGIASLRAYYRAPSGSGSYSSASVTGQSSYDVTVSSGGNCDLYLSAANGAGTVNSSVVTGSAASGAITLTGSGFGTKTAAQPFFWQDFASTTDVGALGYSSAQLGYGSNSYGSTLTVSTSSPRVAGKGALRLYMPFTGSGDRDFFPHVVVDTSNDGLGAMASDELYFCFYMKFARLSGSNNSSVQIKGPRSGSGPGTTNDYAELFRYVPSIYVSAAGAYGAIYQEVVSAAGVTSSGEHFGYAALGTWNVGGWNFIEYRMKLNTPGVADGYFKMFINGQDMSIGWDAGGEANHSQVRAREVSSASERFNWSFLLPGVDMPSTTGPGTYELLFSEHFLDTTFSRVIATNNATYASSTKWAPQRAYSWSDGQIVIDEPYYGDLTSGSTVYFHVFNAAGNWVSAHARTTP